MKYSLFHHFCLYALLLASLPLISCRPSGGTGEHTVAEKTEVQQSNPSRISMGAEQMMQYLPLLEGKKVALIANQSSIVGTAHLLDTLLSSGIEVSKIFTPEHGFRGDADAGAHVSSSVDEKTGIPLVSLYGANKTLPTTLLKDIDVLVFDLQDVGTRFYTYISTMHYAMESCAEAGVSFIVLDRPNPNGNYVDGPVLKPAFKSFVGMHPIPVAHGLTVGELAQMINGEGWLKNGKKAELKVIPIVNYTHDSSYVLPVRPSPNLPNHQAVKLYPSLCFFEGTKISVARGTEFPFQAIGAPEPSLGSFTFTPISMPGAAADPPYKGKKCHGLDLRHADQPEQIELSYLLTMYNLYPDKGAFFISFFDKLAGTDQLRKDILAGKREAEIRKSWEADLADFMKIRKKYLLYP